MDFGISSSQFFFHDKWRREPALSIAFRQFGRSDSDSQENELVCSLRACPIIKAFFDFCCTGSRHASISAKKFSLKKGEQRFLIDRC